MAEHEPSELALSRHSCWQGLDACPAAQSPFPTECSYRLDPTAGGREGGFQQEGGRDRQPPPESPRQRKRPLDASPQPPVRSPVHQAAPFGESPPLSPAYAHTGGPNGALPLEVSFKAVNVSALSSLPSGILPSEEESFLWHYASPSLA